MLKSFKSKKSMALVAALGLTMAVSSTTTFAYGHYRHFHHYHGGGDNALAMGLFAGTVAIIAGAALAGSDRDNGGCYDQQYYNIRCYHHHHRYYDGDCWRHYYTVRRCN